MALSNDINDREKAKFIESSSEPGQTGVVVLNPDGSNIGGGSGGGTEYTEGATDASITGSAIMWEDTSDTLRAVSSAKPLPVNIVAGSSSGVQYTEADTDASITGTAIMFESNTTSSRLDTVSNDKPLPTTPYGPTGASCVENDSIIKVSIKDGAGDSVMDDTNNAVRANIVAGKVGHDITGIGHGIKTITTAGTDEALAASTACKRVVIQAQTDNTTGVAVGGSGVDATVATGTGVFLYAGDSIELEIDNLADVYIDALTNGEGVRYTYFT